MYRWTITVLMALLFICGSRLARALTPPETVSKLHDRLVGVPLPLNDVRRPALEALVAQGKVRQAIDLMLEEDNFFNGTLVDFATPLSDRAEDVFADLNETVAMIVGTVRDHRDFREILTGDYTYQGPATWGKNSLGDPLADPVGHYNLLAANRLNLRKTLVRREPQRPDSPDSAGVLTSNGFGRAHLFMGTNRRAVDYSFREFLCTSVEEVGDATLPDVRVHRDVDRKPGGNTQTYLNTCRRCHAGMDSLVGAFAHVHYNFFPEFITRVRYHPKVLRRMNQHGDVYPEGYITRDNSWENLWTSGDNVRLGWRGPTQGRGLREYGEMLAHSKAFSQCMAKRVFTRLCRREPEESEKEIITRAGEHFEQNGYQLQSVFAEVAQVPQCIGAF